MSDLSPPIQLFSVHFQHPGGEAIPLRDPATNTLLGDSPEWIRNHRDEPVAYVGGTRPMIHVRFITEYDIPSEIQLSAWGPPLEGPREEVVCWLKSERRAVDARADVTGPWELRFSRPLPERIGRYTLELQWRATLWWPNTLLRNQIIGTSTHQICTTWREMNVRGDLERWAYTPLMLWTSEWCAGKDNEKAICDAVLARLPETNLRYGMAGWDVRYMLLSGAGMCGGWTTMFQRMANCQGVFVERHTLRLVPKEDPRTKEVLWRGMSVREAGLNQVAPTLRASVDGVYNDEESQFPLPRRNAVRKRMRGRRYFFGSTPVGPNDGHCVNILRLRDGKRYLYDPCFLRGGLRLDIPVPKPGSGTQTVHLSEGARFRRDYFDVLVPFLMGDLRVNGKLEALSLDEQRMGTTVATPLIPEIAVEWQPEGDVQPATGTATEQGAPSLGMAPISGDPWKALEEANGLLQTGSPNERTDAVERLHRVLRHQGVIPLSPGAPMTHSMPPEDLLKQQALEGLREANLEHATDHGVLEKLASSGEWGLRATAQHLLSKLDGA